MKKNRVLKSMLSVALIGAGVGMIPLAFNTTESPMEYVETQDVPTDPIPDTPRMINHESITNDNDEITTNDANENLVILEQGAYSFGVEETDGSITGNLMLTFDATNLTPEDLGHTNEANLYYRVKKTSDTDWGVFTSAPEPNNKKIVAGEINYIDLWTYKDFTGNSHTFVDGEEYQIEIYITASTTPPLHYDPAVDGFADSLSFTWTQNSTTFGDSTYNKAYPIFDYLQISAGTDGATVDLVSSLGWGVNSTNYSILGYNFYIYKVGDISNVHEVNKTTTDHDGGTESFNIDLTPLSVSAGDQIVVTTEMVFEDINNGWPYAYSLVSDPITISNNAPAVITVSEPSITDNGSSLDVDINISIDDPDAVIDLTDDLISGGYDMGIALTGGPGYIDLNNNEQQDPGDDQIVGVDLSVGTVNDYQYTLHLNELDYDTQYTITLETYQNVTGGGPESKITKKSFNTPSEAHNLQPGVLVANYIDDLNYSFTVYGFSIGNTAILSQVKLVRISESDDTVEEVSTTGSLNNSTITFTNVTPMEYGETYTYWVEYYDNFGQVITTTNVVTLGTPDAPNPNDPMGDIDNDGTLNESDTDWEFYNPTMDPLLDSDGDNINNKEDDDDDNDGILDGEDHFPFDDNPAEDPMNDEDGDGILNESDTDWIYYNPTMDPELDSDGDNINNKEDDDDDNDGILDGQDHYPFDPTDGKNPNDPTEDLDGDGILNESDTDWEFYNPTMDPLLDSDGDGTNNKEDSDDDNDGILDGQDHFPFDDNPTEDPMNDSDEDGILNESDTDWEYYNPTMDPLLDSDGDGKNNKEDSDDDNDGILDGEDHYPLGNEPEEEPVEDPESDPIYVPVPVDNTADWVIPVTTSLTALAAAGLMWFGYDVYRKSKRNK